MENRSLEVRRTADGSFTLYVPALDEHYHSHHGARQESAHVFLKHGLWPLLHPADGSPARGAEPGGNLHILEIGLGTGLNAILTLESCAQAAACTTYTALETVPLPPDVVDALAYEYYPAPGERRGPSAGQAVHGGGATGAALTWLGDAFRALHAAPWNQETALAADFQLAKWLAPLETAEVLPANDGPVPDLATDARLTAGHYHLIYFDAFAPEKQPELWTEAIFATLYAAAAPGAVLVTYCAQGQFRRNLRAAGWLVEKLPGPPGKREMTRARKAE